MFTEEDKIIIKYLRTKYGHGRIRILEDHREKTEWTLGGIGHLLEKIDVTNSVQRKGGSGRPKDIRTPDNIETVEKLVLSQEDAPQTHSTPAQIVQQTGISESSVRRIIDEDLQLMPLKKITAQALNDLDVEKRLTRCKRLLRIFTHARVERTFFSDEKIFKLQQWYNNQNDRVYVKKGTLKSDVEDARLLVEQKKWPRSIMVSAGVSKLGKTSLHFVKPGVRIDGEFYRKKLMRKIIPEMHNLAGGPNEFYIFMQDGAKPHTADETVEFLKAEVPMLLEPKNWPPNSPDLNPVDFSIWSILQQNVFRGAPITTLDQLKKRLKEEWKKLPQDQINRAIDSFRPRLHKVVECEGRHIDKYF